MTKNLMPQEYLETLQEDVYAERGMRKPEATFAPSDEQAKYMEDFLAKWAPDPAEAAEVKAQLEARFKIEIPTTFEDPLAYSMISSLYDQIEAGAKYLEVALPTRPQLGTLPIGSVNAITVAVPGSEEYLLLFEADLFVFSSKLSEAIARAMCFVRAGDGEVTLRFKNSDPAEILRNDPEMISRCLEVIVAYLLLGTPSAAPMHPSDPESGIIATHLTDSMQLFVMGHEYAHLILGHLAGATKVKAAVAGVEINKVERSWKQEIEADINGLALMMYSRKSRGSDLALSFWGADFFFSCIEMIERGLSVLNTGDDNQGLDGSHPPASERRKVLREALAQFAPAVELKEALHLAVTLEVLFDQIWTGARSILQKEYERGRRPPDRWKL